MNKRPGFSKAGMFIGPLILFLFFAVVAASGGPIVPGSSQADIEFAAENLTDTNFTSPSLTNPSGGLFNLFGDLLNFMGVFLGEGGIAVQAIFVILLSVFAYAIVDAIL